MKILLVGMLIVVVSGCSSVSLIYGGLDMTSNITTGKGVVDNVVSEMNGADCRIHRLFKGEEICKKDE